MRWVWLMVLVVSCAPAVAAPAPTEDRRIAEAQQANETLRSERDALAAQVQRLQADAIAPTFVMFDVPFTIGAGQAVGLGMPDTFTVRIAFSATTPVRARIMTLPQYASYQNGKPFDALTYPASTSLDVTFHDAEGCAGYVLVLDAAQTALVTPRFLITRASPKGYTGYCAH